MTLQSLIIITSHCLVNKILWHVFPVVPSLVTGLAVSTANAQKCMDYRTLTWAIS